MFDASYIIQLDVLVKNGIASKGAIAFMKKLEEEGMPYIIVTEQSGRIQDHIADYLVERGFRYIRYLGGAGIKEVLEKGNYQITFDHPDFIIMGMNKKSTYYDYSRISLAVQDGAMLVSSDNRNVQFVDGLRMIGNAAIVKMIEYATGCKSISFGRGCDNYLLMAKLYLNQENILFIGNDFERDILPAMHCEFTTVFVTEGNSIENTGMNEQHHPDYIVEDLFGLTK